MNDRGKTKKQLLDELTALRRQIAGEDGTAAALDDVFQPAEFYKHLLENIKEGILVTDSRDRIFFVNGPMAGIAGLPREQISGSLILHDFPEDTLKYFRPAYREAKESLKAVSFAALPVCTPAGRLTYQSGLLVPRIRNSRFNGMICTIFDDTEREHNKKALLGRIRELNCIYALAELVEKTGNLDELFQGAVEHIIADWLDAENDCARVIFEKREFKTANFRETAQRMLAALTVNKIPVGLLEVCRGETPAGAEEPFSAEEHSLLNVIAERLGIVAERKQLQEALRESEELYRTALESANDGMAIVRDGRYVYVNQKYMGSTKRNKDELIGEAFGTFMHPDDRKVAVACIGKCQQGLESFARFDVRVNKPDGTLTYGQISAVAVTYKGAKSVLIIAQDTTEHRKEEEKLKTLVSSLQKALLEIKTLKGIVPICARCKKIRDDKGYWDQVEEYVSKHTEAQFSHGICPECIAKLYPELAPDKKTD